MNPLCVRVFISNKVNNACILITVICQIRTVIKIQSYPSYGSFFVDYGDPLEYCFMKMRFHAKINGTENQPLPTQTYQSQLDMDVLL